MKIDYDKMYVNRDPEQFSWVKKVCLWKAQKINELIGESAGGSLLEIGTGRGDVLNACCGFSVRIGADISAEALEQHRKVYGTQKLVHLDADALLPFEDNSINYVLLCDILEHVNNPVGLLQEASRVGKNVILKIPIENALLIRFMHKFRGIKYGPQHPAGHLYCWKLSDALRIINEAGLRIIRGKFVSTPINLFEKKFLLKTSILILIKIIDFFAPDKYVTRYLIGGSYFAIATKSL